MLSAEERSSATNGIWLCQKCSRLIDVDPYHYTRDLLLGWKEKSEEYARWISEGRMEFRLDIVEASHFREELASQDGWIVGDVTHEKFATASPSGVVTIVAGGDVIEKQVLGTPTVLRWCAGGSALVVCTTRGAYRFSGRDFAVQETVLPFGQIYDCGVTADGVSMVFAVKVPTPRSFLPTNPWHAGPVPSSWFEIWHTRGATPSRLEWSMSSFGRHFAQRYTVMNGREAPRVLVPQCVDISNVGLLLFGCLPAHGAIYGLLAPDGLYSLEKGASTSYSTCAFEPDAATAALGTSAGSIYLFDVKTSEPRSWAAAARLKYYEILGGRSIVEGVRYDERGERIAAFSRCGCAVVVSSQRHEVIWGPKRFDSEILSMSFDPNGGRDLLILDGTSTVQRIEIDR